jgi:hypothetical protein
MDDMTIGGSSHDEMKMVIPTLWLAIEFSVWLQAMATWNHLFEQSHSLPIYVCRHIGHTVTRDAKRK